MSDASTAASDVVKRTDLGEAGVEFVLDQLRVSAREGSTLAGTVLSEEIRFERAWAYVPVTADVGRVGFRVGNLFSAEARAKWPIQLADDVQKWFARSGGLLAFEYWLPSD